MIFHYFDNLNNRCILLILTILTGVLFGHTLDTPWYFDDYPIIIENPAIRDMSRAIRALFSQPRGLATLTFALNFQIGGTDPTYYHLFNLLLHALNSFLVYKLLEIIFERRVFLALSGSLIFLVHPVQTQAVNYVVQRSTLLATLFALLSILLFLKARAWHNRNGFRDQKQLVFYVLAILTYLVSVATKQNTATLPLIMLCLAVLLDRESALGREIIYITPFILIPLAIAVPLVITPLLQGTELAAIANTRPLSNLEGSNPLRYFITQLEVFFLYMKLYLFPVNLRLDYAYPIVNQIINLKSLLYLVLHGIILLLAFLFRHKYRFLAIGVFWFYLALLVESSFIPLDPVYEHRLYFPIVGLIIPTCWFVGLVSEKKWQVTIIIVILIPLCILTWQRNTLWKDQIGFTENNAELSPHGEGVWISLALLYLNENRFEDALDALEKAKEINPDYPSIYINSTATYIKLRQPEKALAEARTGLKLLPGNLKLRKNLSMIYSLQGQHREAIEILKRLSNDHPSDVDVYELQAQNYIDLGAWGQAEDSISKALRLKEDLENGYYLLGFSQYQQKKYSAAIESLKMQLMQNPDDAEALYGLGMTSLEIGDRETARSVLVRLQKNSPQSAAQLRATMNRLKKFE